MLSGSLSYFDLAVLAVMGLSCLFAFWRGFVKEILSLSAWIGAGLITIYWFPEFTDHIKGNFKNPTVAAGVATLTLYIGSLLGFSMLNAFIMRFLKQGSDIGFLDNSLGLLFGAFRGAFILSLAYFLMTIVIKEEDYPDWIATAHSRPFVEDGAILLARAAPAYLREISALNDKIDGHQSATSKRVALFNDEAAEAIEEKKNEVVERLGKSAPAR